MDRGSRPVCWRLCQLKEYLLAASCIQDAVWTSRHRSRLETHSSGDETTGGERVVATDRINLTKRSTVHYRAVGLVDLARPARIDKGTGASGKNSGCWSKGWRQPKAVGPRLRWSTVSPP